MNNVIEEHVELAEIEEQENTSTEYTSLQLLAQTFQKLADTAQRGHRDNANPTGLRRQLKGNWESFTTAAMVCRDAAEKVAMGKPPGDQSLLISLCQTALKVSEGE